jgi:phosphate starvation-inducible protein PhoH and related proteins
MHSHRHKQSENIMKHKTVLSFDDLRDDFSRYEVRPRSANQYKYWNLLAHGPAGCGKTLLATQNGIDLLKLQKIEKIVITRPVVGADEDIGFLPGTLQRKMEPWTRPLIDIFHKNYTVNRVQKMIRDEQIEIAPLAFMRGRTFENSYIIADEMQNTTVNQFKMLLTRIGEGSKLVITGDLDQTDRGKNNGMADFLHKLWRSQAHHICNVQLMGEDIVRHKAVSEALKIYDCA